MKSVLDIYELISLSLLFIEPFPPQNLEVCVHGNNSGHELRVSWMVSEIVLLSL